MLVNNAGVVRGNKYFWETDRDRDTKLTIDVNTLGPMYVAHEFLPSMIAADGECRMLNLASAAGFTPNPRMAVYAASKWAVIGWSDSVRLELKQAGHDHVKVTTVCPYYVRTGMFEGARSAPLLPLLDPADVVDEAWSAMLAGRPFVVLPKTVMLSEMLKGRRADRRARLHRRPHHRRVPHDGGLHRPDRIVSLTALPSRHSGVGSPAAGTSSSTAFMHHEHQAAQGTTHTIGAGAPPLSRSRLHSSLGIPSHRTGLTSAASARPLHGLTEPADDLVVDLVGTVQLEMVHPLVGGGV